MVALFGVKLQDLFVALLAVDAALLIITAVAIFTIFNVIIFTIIPILTLIIGLILLINPVEGLKIVAKGPLQGLINLANHSDSNFLILVLGFFAAGLAWNSYFVGHSSSPLAKSVYGLLISLTSGLLAYKKLAGLTDPTAAFQVILKDQILLALVTLTVGGIIVSGGHLIGPKIIQRLENKYSKC